MSEKMTTTYSMWNAFRNCRKLCEYRYFKNIVPISKPDALSFGSLIHECLDLWYSGVSIQGVLTTIDEAFPDRQWDDKQMGPWHKATAMMRGYAERYPSEDWSVVATEKEFTGPIVNPRSRYASRVLELSGKVDGIVKVDGELFLLEHKTASAITSGYLEALWTDFQITLYTWYLRQEGYPIRGIVYNILGKTSLKQRGGETEEEFESRRADLLAKSKTGKSSAKQKIAESDEEFQERLLQKYREPGMFHRETLYLPDERITEIQSELWELSRALLAARRENLWYRNTSYCFRYNRPCSYYPLCQSGDNPNVLENMFETRAPHEELEGAGVEDATGATTSF